MGKYFFGLFLGLLIFQIHPTLQAASNANPASIPIGYPLGSDPHYQRHLALMKLANQSDAPLVFLGDSITEYWEREGAEVWKNTFEPLRALNLGIGGDRTNEILWRLNQGLLDHLSPQVLVLTIGTNNSADRAEEVADGISEIVQLIRKRLPNTHLLFHAILPIGAQVNPRRLKDQVTNQMIEKLDDGRWIHFIDFGSRFVEPDGSISEDVMYDATHLTSCGYEIWAQELLPVIQGWLYQN